MRAWGRGVMWWARTAQKSGSRLLPNAAVPVWFVVVVSLQGAGHGDGKHWPIWSTVSNKLQFSSGSEGSIHPNSA